MSANPGLSAPAVEQHPTGFGIGIASPRLSWRFLTRDSLPQSWEQTAYDMEISRPGETTESHHVLSNASVLVPWPATPLRSREQVRVRVRAYGNLEKEPTDWSPWTLIECALLHRHDWKALPITGSPGSDTNGPLRPLRFRRKFFLSQNTPVAERSRLYITALGVFRAFINGKAIGDECMAPGWTSYKHHLNYRVFDIAPHLNRNGENVTAVEVGEGWYAGRLGFNGGRRFIYGKEIGLLAQLEIGVPGSDQMFTLVSDNSWSCQPSAILRSEIYDGETYDAREETARWDALDCDDRTWQSVRQLEFPKSQLVAPNAPPVRVTEEVKPISIITTPSGKTVVDFGQNLVGRLCVHSLDKPRGYRVSFVHAEVLENGELGTRPLRVAKCTDEIISSGSKLENWSPQFTFHGFRYVQVNGWSPTDKESPLLLSSLSALVLHTDMERTGWFSCSHAMVNQLHQNALWSMRGNFLSIPTDCPQRDERLGWTGDIQAFCPSANFLYHTAGMLGDWLNDLSAEQFEEENYPVPPFVIPNVIQTLWPQMPQAVWDDATILVPWSLYRSYGDINILKRQYPSMTAWIDEGVRRGPDRLWDKELWQLGDWLDPTAPPEDPGAAQTSGTLVADAYLVHVTSILAQISEILGDTKNATRYKTESQQLKATFQNKYVAPSGLLVGDTQTGLSLAIVFDLHSHPEQSSVAGDRLAHLVRQAKFRVATGFAGTPIITHALTKSGNHQLAYRMLLEKNKPSWMYPITLGATTIWERWDSMLPDGSVNPGEMTSFNHYALGSVINWLHESVAGISPIEPGWKTFRVAPVPGGTITSAESQYETPYGRLECRWSIHDGDQFELDLLVPANSRALVTMPHEGTGSRSTTNLETSRWVGSGRHQFTCRCNNLDGWPPAPFLPPLRDSELDSIV